MLPEAEEAWTQNILRRAAERFGADPEDLEDCNGGENHVYAFRRSGREYVLRIGHSVHRSEQLVQAEIDWVNYLASHGLPVSSPSPSLSGRWVEVIGQDGVDGYFMATAFGRAPGEDLGGGSRSKAEWWNGALFEQWGALMGRLHRLARDYQVRTGAPRRPESHEWPILELGRWIPNDQTTVIELGAALKARLAALPKEGSSYGLIHGDFTQVNFTVSRGAMAVFDFDRCEYGWFSKDIATALFTAVRGSQPTTEDFPAVFLNHLVRGYRTEKSLDAMWLKPIPDFLKLERLSEYALAYRRLGGRLADGDWMSYLLSTRRAIEQDTQVIPFDFSAWAE